MRLDYIKVWKLLGVSKLPAGPQTSTLGDPPMDFSLTEDPEPYFVHIDKFQAVANGLLKGLLKGGEDGSLEERLDSEIGAAKARRAENRRLGSYLIALAVTDVPEPEFKARRDAGDFEIAIDGLDKEAIHKTYRPAIDAILTGLALRLPSNADLRCEEIGSVIFLTTNGAKPLYAFSFTRGNATLSVASLPPADLLDVAGSMAEKMLDDTKLRRPIALLTSSINNTSDPLQAYLDGWNALEIFVQSVFKSTYDAPVARDHGGGSSSGRKACDRSVGRGNER
ncbi:hypothetical protein QN219_24045 [Sinorhizobium sp. 7-81]|uniref:hypothetical protein n=1 Tax=Sinorhizobium sp. 8-89 TaxID=3049089 RepID=UPI0024C26E8E|nr:hypothetical protein [Sinorhizobium sp. 8-89]MDK1493080.1 hypothetical protein [Sinorhizobium sp. 8-89]